MERVRHQDGIAGTYRTVLHAPLHDGSKNLVHTVHGRVVPGRPFRTGLPHHHVADGEVKKAELLHALDRFQHDAAQQPAGVALPLHVAPDAVGDLPGKTVADEEDHGVLVAKIIVDGALGHAHARGQILHREAAPLRLAQHRAGARKGLVPHRRSDQLFVLSRKFRHASRLLSRRRKTASQNNDPRSFLFERGYYSHRRPICHRPVPAA